MSKSRFFNQPVSEEQSIIVDLKPVDFDAFCKVIRIIEKIIKKSPFSIFDSRYSHSFDYGKSFILMDLRKILGNGTTISFVGNTKLLRKIIGNENVLIIRCDEYLITNGLYEVRLGHSELKEKRNIPDLKDSEKIGVDLVFNDELGSLRAFTSTSKHVDLLLHIGQLDQILLPNKKRYSFDQVVTGDSRIKRPEQALRTYRFLAVPGKKAIIRIVKKDGQIWMVTITSLAMELEMYLYESVEIVNF